MTHIHKYYERLGNKYFPNGQKTLKTGIKYFPKATDICTGRFWEIFISLHIDVRTYALLYENKYKCTSIEGTTKSGKVRKRRNTGRNTGQPVVHRTSTGRGTTSTIAIKTDKYS
jgi:hypothetical protein